MSKPDLMDSIWTGLEELDHLLTSNRAEVLKPYQLEFISEGLQGILREVVGWIECAEKEVHSSTNDKPV